MEKVAAVRSRRASALRHYCADAGVNLEYAIRYQVRDNFVSCIGIDLQILAELSHGRKRVTRAHLA
jgi:hypothetical protein